MNFSTLATTLAVNPAFLEEIKDSNTTLWQRLEELRSNCDCHDAKSLILRRLVNQLNEIRDLLALQFALEESYGYMEVPESDLHEPNASPERLRAQHCALYLTASELAEQAEELQYRGWAAQRVIQLIRQVKQFDLQLQDHERAERHLVASVRETLRHRS